MEVQNAPVGWKTVLLADGSWEIRGPSDNKLATVEKDYYAESLARLIATSAYTSDALALLLTVIGDEELPDNGYYSAEDRAGIRDMALSAVKASMGNDEWNWRFGLDLE